MTEYRVFNLISPMACDEKNWMCLFTICLSSLIKCLFMSFAYFILALFFNVKFKECFIYFRYELFIKYVVQIFSSQSIACIFIFLFYFAAYKQKLFFMKTKLLLVSFMDCVFSAISKNSPSILRSQRFSLMLSP